jgi:SAM-dependent methyltransferase
MEEASAGGALPIPPNDFLQRIGLSGASELAPLYERTGRSDRKLIETLLPDDWDWHGKRVLDFGCGVGRIMRQFAPEAGEAEFWGCDLDRTSIEWARRNLEPPLHFFESDEAPGLPQEDGYFDLIYAFSVYTHFTDNWAGWLLEHHRVLAEGGFLLATFLGEGMSEHLIGEPWDEDRIGMNPLLHDNPWDQGGPIALNSPWWIRAHWGRAFEIVELQPRAVDDLPSHGLVLAQKKAVDLSVEDLTRLEADEPREIAALQHHAEQLIEDTRRLRTHAGQLGAKADVLEGELASVTESASWRLTAPLRSLKARVRRG